MFTPLLKRANRKSPAWKCADLTAIAQRILAVCCFGSRRDHRTKRNKYNGEVSLRDILKLQPGDVIPIDIPPRIEATVDGIALLECSYGQQNGQYALRIEKFIASPEGGAGESAPGDKNVG